MVYGSPVTWIKGRSPHGPDTIPHFPMTLYSNAQRPGPHARRTPSPRCSLRPWRQAGSILLAPLQVRTLLPPKSVSHLLQRPTDISTMKTMAQSHGFLHMYPESLQCPPEVFRVVIWGTQGGEGGTVHTPSGHLPQEGPDYPHSAW